MVSAGFLGNSPSVSVGVSNRGQGLSKRSRSQSRRCRSANSRLRAQQEEANREWAEHPKRDTLFIMMFISGAISAAGIGLAYLLHLKNRHAGEELPEKFPALARLFEAKYWVDEIYQAAIVEPLRALGRGFFWVDRMIVDGTRLDVVELSFRELGGWILKLTTR